MMNVGKDTTEFTDETKSLKANDFTQLLSEEKVRSFHLWIFIFFLSSEFHSEVAVSSKTQENFIILF